MPACTFWCVHYSPEHARMKLTHFNYLQLTIHWQIKHFTVKYERCKFLTLKLNIFLLRKKNPISDPNLPTKNCRSPYLSPRKDHMYGLAYRTHSKIVCAFSSLPAFTFPGISLLEQVRLQIFFFQHGQLRLRFQFGDKQKG